MNRKKNAIYCVNGVLVELGWMGGMCTEGCHESGTVEAGQGVCG